VDLDARSFIQTVLCHMMVLRYSPGNITFKETEDFYDG
jgi:hypothetical protein